MAGRTMNCSWAALQAPVLPMSSLYASAREITLHPRAWEQLSSLVQQPRTRITHSRTPTIDHSRCVQAAQVRSRHTQTMGELVPLILQMSGRRITQQLCGRAMDGMPNRRHWRRDEALCQNHCQTLRDLILPRKRTYSRGIRSGRRSPRAVAHSQT